MKTKSSNKQNAKQRLITKPLFWRLKNKKSWRAKHYNIKLTPSKSLHITLRRFKTNPKNRSKKYSQKVYNLNIFGVKEIALRQKQISSRQKNKKTVKVLKPSFANVFMFVGLAGILIFGLQIIGSFNATPPVARAEPSAEAIVEQPPAIDQLPESKPISLAIPSIGIDASIDEMGQAKDGTIETPDIFDHTVGWYKHSPTPGEIGPSVLLGHVDNYKGPSVFWRLGEIAVGSSVNVKRQDGTVANFNVRAIEQYSQDEFPTQKVYGNTDGSELRLITCGGSFNYFTLRYSKNTVVYADLVI